MPDPSDDKRMAASTRRFYACLSCRQIDSSMNNRHPRLPKQIHSVIWYFGAVLWFVSLHGLRYGIGTEVIERTGFT